MPPFQQCLDNDVDSCDGQQRRKSLDFGTVEVLEFPVIVGDNPFVTDGCPIALDCHAKQRKMLTVEVYENHYRRQDRRDDFKLSVSDRAELLLSAGFTLDDIIDATLEADETKRLRAESRRNPVDWASRFRKMLNPRKSAKSV